MNCLFHQRFQFQSTPLLCRMVSHLLLLLCQPCGYCRPCGYVRFSFIVGLILSVVIIRHCSYWITPSFGFSSLLRLFSDIYLPVLLCLQANNSFSSGLVSVFDYSIECLSPAVSPRSVEELCILLFAFIVDSVVTTSPFHRISFP